MATILSPSGMMAYRQCPLRYYGEYVTKELPWKPSKAKLRGTAVHQLLEGCVKNGYSDDTKWDMGMDLDFVKRSLDRVLQLKAEGWRCFLEHPLAVDRNLVPCDYWDENALLRCRLDLLMLPPEEAGTSPAYVVDFKTGRKWDDEDLQLKIYAVLVSICHGSRPVAYQYWYVDDGKKVVGFIESVPAEVGSLLQDMLLAERNKFYPPKPNRFCKWCGFWQTPKCEVKR